MVDLSILIPNYNYGRFLAECLESTSLASSGINAEIIVSDNASTDESVQVIRGAMSRDARIRLIQHSLNMPFQDNWNSCLIEARGTYAHYVCSDDILHRGTLHEKMTFIKKRKDCSIVNQDFLEVNSSLKIGKRIFCLPGEHTQESVGLLTLRAGCNLIGGPSNFLFVNNGKLRFSKEFRWLADLDFYIGMLKYGKYAHVSGVGYLYRRHEATLSNEIDNSDRVREWSAWKKAANALYDSSSVPAHGFLRWTQMRVRNKVELFRSWCR